MKNIIKRIFISCFLVLLLLPLIQSRKRLIHEPQLSGVFSFAKKSVFSRTSVLTGDFQRSYEAWFNDHIGFKATFIKSYNQFNYTFFNKSTNKDIEIGKKGFLYEIPFIDAYLGNNYAGTKKIDESVLKLKQIQSYLAANGKYFLFVFAPAKTYYYPEYLPEHYFLPSNRNTNYHDFTLDAKKYGLNFIDFNSYFVQMKKKSPYPLFPEYGIHWNAYGATIATDSIISYFKRRFNLKLRNYKINGFELSSNLREPDYDLGNLLNLFQMLPHRPMPYPAISFDNDSSKTRLQVLTVGDSFYWNIVNTGIFEKLFDHPAFWYYNTLVYPESYVKEKKVKDLDYKSYIDKKNIIIVLVSDPNLLSVTNNFINNFYIEYAINSKQYNINSN